ncbi:MAG: FAD-dependent oxidoreductase, partial [Firmicutes bacterium]|nr:FAD-dependent oxidoreductase [Bacillota bacterium]
AIGNLERFAADWERETRGDAAAGPNRVNGKTKGRVAVVGSGPAGLTAAAELSRLGYAVTIFEALHTPGGVLAYGIPEFRLPKAILAHEFRQLERLGVELKTNVLIGSTLTVDDLFAEGFQAVFLGTGAGLPNLLGIPGEDLNGVYTANEFLTRVNLMKAYLYPEVDTPLYLGRRVVVIGSGNTAMDAARTAVRLGIEVMVVDRRSREGLLARQEEVIHAEEEGVEFRFLTSPIAIRGDEEGWVEAIQCVNMELGEPTENGRPNVRPIAGSEHWLPADSVIVAIGQGPNPIIARTTPGLETGLHGVLKVAPETFMTSREGVFAAGDIITGGATVIKAMGGGKKAAQAIDRYLRLKNSRVSD